MKKVIAFAFALAASAAAFPVHVGLVTDDAGVLSVAERSALEERLRAFEARTSVEVAVATVRSLDGLSIDDYRAKLFRAWGVGKKGKDNGVLLVFAPNEPPTGKVGIEVGYGLEPILTDGVVGAIIRERIRPGWRSSHRAAGIVAGVDAILERLDRPLPEAAAGLNATVPTPAPAQTGDDYDVLFWLAGLALVVAGVAAAISLRLKRRREAREAEARLATYVQTFEPPRPYTTRALSGAMIRRQEQYRRPAQPRERDVYAPYVAPDPDPPRRSSSSDSSSSSSSSSSDSSSSDFSFGGGSSGGGGSSSDL